MADITLTVDYEFSTNLNDAVSRLISKINASPPKIKVAFDIDEAEVNRLKKQISDINISAVKAAKSGSKFGSVTSGTSYLQGIANGAKAANSQMSATKAHLKAANAALKEINTTNSTITSSYKSLQKTLGGSTATEQNATDLSAMKSKYLELQTAVENLRTAKASATQEDINNIYRLQSEMQNLISTTQQRITTEKEAATAAEQAAKAEATAAEQAAAAKAKAAQKQISDAAAKESALKSYYSTLQRCETALKNYSAAENSTKSSEAYRNIREVAGSLKSAHYLYDNGSLSFDEFKKKVASANTVLAKSKYIIKANGDAAQTLSSRLDGLASKFSSWLTVSQAIMLAIRGVKQMVSAAVEIESVMTQIKIVTGASDSQMESFLTKSIGLAKELGQNITDVASSIETFARLGYNMSDSSNLAKYANIMANVGNTDVDTATTGITSIIKGYELDANDVEHVLDVLVKVGQEYAISAEELMAAFQRGGAALHASGTDFEKSAALFAATNASLQNAETAGTMWKTVSARIRGATTELEEMGEETDGLAQGLSKYREEIMALSGVDIMKDENTYKDMYDIFVQLAEVWDNMEDVSQSRVAEILGGTRNTSGIMSTITNIQDAIGAYSSAMDSAGTATEANNIYMDTTEAKVGELKAAFQELSSDFVKSNFTKTIVEGLKTLVEAIDTVVNSIGSLGAVLAGVGIVKFITNVA